MSLTPAVTVEAAQLGGPPWLVERRRATADRLDAVEVPDDGAEVWRYSPIRDLDLDAFDAPSERDWAPETIDADGAAARIRLVDGRVQAIGLAPDVVGLDIGIGRDGADAPFDVPFGDEYVALMAETLASDPIYIRVQPGRAIEAPVVIEHEAATSDGLVATLVAVHAGADSEVTVVERRHSGPHRALVIPLLDITVEDAGRVRHVDAQLLGEHTWQLGQQRARVGAQATLSMYQAGLGGRYARMRTDCQLIGQGAHGTLSAVYLGGDHQTLDYRTFQDHVGADTTSNLLFKGAVDDHARSIYSGLIRVRPTARGTSAFQTNRNIKLSETAWAESVPNLEIETNDVRCSHASTVGPIDEDQRFYLESRGVPPEDAEQLILAGFFAEVLQAMPAPALAHELSAVIATRLEGTRSR